MSHYRSNLRDIFFNLFEVLGRDEVLGHGPYEDMDHDTAVAVLTEIEHLATTKLASSYVDSDRHPPVYDPQTRTVALPEAFKASYATLLDSGFYNLELPAELGGQPSPPSLQWAANELNLGANPALLMYAAGPKFATVLWHNGTERDRRIAQIMIDRRWGATMVLTEPDAGSDVGAGRTRAVPQPDGSWHLEGVKRFITSGEQDMTENIVHLVLARPVGVEGAGGPGTKGLSLFIVPKYHFDAETGELGERNGVYATNVEHKMGLKVSNTCELTFGEHGIPAKGWLLGDVHEGIKQMFSVIEYARMMVGTKAIATLSTGYLNALDYAKSRVQGADLLRQSDKTAPRVTITHHPDVRRSLALQKAYAEGLRALVVYTGGWQDKVRLAEHFGDAAAAKVADKVNDLLLPLVKGCGSERAYELLGHEALQTYGGSGYLQDYPLEQYVRDAKIDALYEGTTAIQSLDLIFRKIVKDGGAALGVVFGEIKAFLAGEGGNGQLKEERLALAAALADVEGMLGTVVSWLGASADDPAQLYKVGLSSRRILLALGDLLVGWLLQRQAEVALEALRRESLTETDRHFYQGKVVSARFFAREVLPRLGSDRRIVDGTTLDLMDLPEDAF
jgi:alkylation response protein AidB-like acyl-CoA dehydrogenase